MTKSILETIGDVIVARLEEITIGNGYAFTATVERDDRNLNEFVPEPRKIIVQLVRIEENEELSYPGNPPRIAYSAEFRIHGYGEYRDQDNTHPGVPDVGVSDEHVIAAIRKALVAGDAEAWQNFDSNAIYGRLSASDTFDGPNADGATTTLMVTYRTPEPNPYVVG